MWGCWVGFDWSWEEGGGRGDGEGGERERGSSRTFLYNLGGLALSLRGATCGLAHADDKLRGRSGWVVPRHIRAGGGRGEGIGSSYVEEGLDTLGVLGRLRGRRALASP